MLGRNGAASTSAAKEWADEQRAAGRTPIKAEVEERVLDMAESVSAVLASAGVAFEASRSEMAAFGDVDGVACRCMVDNAPASGPLYDLKTTTDASPEAVTRAVMSYGYDIQVAHYLDTWKAATGEDRSMRLVFVEKEAPYAVTVAEIDGEALEMARRKVARARMLWAECLRSGQWPSYPLAVLRIRLPDYFHARGLEDEAAREDWRAAAGDKPSRAAMAAASDAMNPHKEITR